MVAASPDAATAFPHQFRFFEAALNDRLLAAHPMFGNPLTSRDDVARAAVDLFTPLLPYFSEGGARVQLNAAGAVYDMTAAELEGFARPLWGLAPLAAGGIAMEHWELFRRGLANGTDPEHPEYWGDVRERDQRLVELAAIGLAMRLVPEHIWEPLDERSKGNVAAYLLKARTRGYVDNNWKFFRVLVDLGLLHCGIEHDRSLTTDYLDEMEPYCLGDGWYRDGPVSRVDHYVPFALHFYGLIYAAASDDEPRAARYRERARQFAGDIRHWYADDGAALPFGRSQTYRFAAAGFWGALAYADLEALPWGEIKGYYLRHLRWWAHRPIADRDGVLSVGYAYPNLLISESYNSACSPYWAMKAFLPLALPADHPFWLAEEAPAPRFEAPVPLPKPGMVATHSPGTITVLASGQHHERMRGAAEKYAKFVYSTRYGFSVEADDRNYDWAALDGMIGFSDDGMHFRMRETVDEALIAGELLYSRWRPWPDVKVETWLVPAGHWHIRLHSIDTPRPLHSTEGGFAVKRADFFADPILAEAGHAMVTAAEDVSVIRDLSAGTPRQGRVQPAIANTNLMHAKTYVPQLLGNVPSGTTVLAMAAMALPHGDVARTSAEVVPALPDLDQLRERIAREGVRVAAFLGPLTSQSRGP
jgi:hypothetical protein